jgi:mono/diheme cytochrome c family protein
MVFKNLCSRHNSHLKRIASILALMVFAALLSGCGKDPSQQTDAELGLNSQQAHGRRVFQLYCAVCHNAYSFKSTKGPSLKGLYKKEYLPSGLLANDKFVSQSIMRGRNMMPPFGNTLTDGQMEDVIAYLHSL